VRLAPARRPWYSPTASEEIACLSPFPHRWVIDTLKDTFKEARPRSPPRGGATRHELLGWILERADTHQKTVLARARQGTDHPRAHVRHRGRGVHHRGRLHAGGEPVVLMIQHAGLYASVNTLRGVAMDGKVPVFYMIGCCSAEKDKDPKESRHSMVRYCEPFSTPSACRTRAWEGPNDVHLIAEYYRLSRQRRGPTAVLVGLETS
jgi:sulfopyruvate decarboxylase TPP-binding subunit